MASSKDFAEFVCEQIAGAGDISMRKMFGEYAVDCDGKVVALICDDQVFVKKTKAAAALLGDNAEEGNPYDGAKPHYLIGDLDDQQFMARLIREIWDELPLPKPKKKRKAENARRPGNRESGRTSPFPWRPSPPHCRRAHSFGKKK